MLFLVPQVAETQYRSWHLVPGWSSSMNNCTSQLDSWRWTAPACPVANFLVPGYGEGNGLGGFHGAWHPRMLLFKPVIQSSCWGCPVRLAQQRCLEEVPRPTQESGFPRSSVLPPATMANTRVQLTGLNPPPLEEVRKQSPELAAAIWLDYETDFTFPNVGSVCFVSSQATLVWNLSLCWDILLQGFDSDLSLNFRGAWELRAKGPLSWLHRWPAFWPRVGWPSGAPAPLSPWGLLLTDPLSVPISTHYRPSVCESLLSSSSLFSKSESVL